jgi:hypothetical protein
MNMLSTNFKQILALIVFILLPASDQFAQEKTDLKYISNEVEFYGKLDADLIPDLKEPFGVVFKQTADLAKYKFIRPLEKDSVVSVGSLLDYRTGSQSKFEVLLVEPKAENPYFYADLNASGTFEENERFLPTASKNNAEDFDQILKLPISNVFYKTFPVFMRFKHGFKHPNLKADERLVFQSYGAFAVGEVSINNKAVRVQYQFQPSESSISTSDGLFGIDTDGDGAILYEPFSSETSYATNDEIVFRLGDLYLSTSKIDLGKNQIVMRMRQKSDYQRAELETGKEWRIFLLLISRAKNERFPNSKANIC